MIFERSSPSIAGHGAFSSLARTLPLLACALLACGRERITVGYTASPRSVDASPAAGRTAAASEAGRSAAGSGGASASCAGALPEEVTSDVVGNSEDPVGFQYAPVKYFAGGAALPQGRYRAEYVDGCFTCCVSLLDVFGLVRGDRAMPVADLPGGVAVDIGGPPVAQCPPPGAPFPPLDFDFAGGPLGVWLSDRVSADNTNGDGKGGRSPTWRLTRLDPCP